jgi:hypothetical protein
MSADVLITIDTELSSSLHRRGVPWKQNYELSFLGQTRQGAFGVPWQMQVLAEHGLKAVYFVDPMPALVYGPELVRDMVAPIIDAGHEVQIHIHTEWLEWAAHEAAGDQRGRNIADFSYDAQVALIGLARDMLVQAGAPAPNAFRAGNYGANDDSLRALATLGIAYDTSFNPTWVTQGCDISLPAEQVAPVDHLGVRVVPVSAFYDRPGHLRHAQVCAVSSREMSGALRHANDHQGLFNIVSHSFEMLSRDRQRPNRSVIARFESMCKAIAERPGMRTVGFHDLNADAKVGRQRYSSGLPSTLQRFVEQAWARWRYERA